MEHIKKTLDQLPKSEKTPSSEPSEILTEEEIKQALDIARQVKLEKAYNEKLKKEPVIIMPNTEEMFEIAVSKGKREIDGFTLTEKEERIYWKLAMYFTDHPGCEKEGIDLKKGLLLFGGVGCGKTTALRLFMINPKLSYAIFSCRQVASEFSLAGPKGGYEAMEIYFDLYPSYFDHRTYGQKKLGMCFDDLGTETSKKHFGNESNVMGEILLTRYDREVHKGIKTHMTTNLNGEQIEEYYGKRVRSRMREMFNIITFPVGDKRK